MTRVRTADGSALAVETIGPDDAPALLLLGGAGWSRDWWDDDLCALLVDRGLRVVRYDPRDTGESSHWPAGAPGYTAADLRATRSRCSTTSGSPTRTSSGCRWAAGSPRTWPCATATASTR